MKFYVVYNFRFDKTGFAYGEKKGKINRGKPIKCEECGSALTMLEWLSPLKVKLSKGKLGDVIFGTFSHFIVSEKFKEIYDKNNFNGVLSFEPVSIYQKGQLISDKYYYPKIILSKTLIDIEKSGVIFEGIEQCMACQKAGRVIKKINGIYFVDEIGIKEDIFCTKLLPESIIFSEQFKEAAKKLLNLSFTEAEKYIPSWII